MKLLIVTQTVDKNDPALGFFHEWLVRFAHDVESLTVICLYEGAHELPPNVSVHSLGKEQGRRNPLSYALRFVRLAYSLRASYDRVFVHMNPEYLMLAGPLWKALGKRTALWYVHKSVPLRLRLGLLFADVVLTASPKSLRVATGKKRVVGHGIPLEVIPEAPPPAYPPLSLLTISRISRVKRIEIFIDALAKLVAGGTPATLTIVGAAVDEDGRTYEGELRAHARAAGVEASVRFAGVVPHTEISRFLAEAHLFLHASGTGSLDKASLEPAASGVPLITTSEELAAIGIPGIMRAEPNGEAFAAAIRQAREAKVWDNLPVRAGLRTFVMEQHDLSRLIPRILAELT